MTDRALAPPRPATWGPPTTPIGVPAGYVASQPDVRPPFDEPTPPHETLPAVIGGGALVVLTVSLLGSKFVLDALVGFEWPVVVYIALTALVGYGPSLAWWWYSTQRWGSGKPLHDVGFRPRWTDIAWGPVIWFATILMQVMVGAIVLGLDIPIANNTDDIGDLNADRTYTIAILITAVVAAPIVEELVFRGMVMRSLLERMPVVAAVILQGVLFGVAHVDPVRGIGNVGLAMVLSGVGISLGGAAYLLRRIGPTMVAHAIFNGLVMLLLLTGWRDQLLENNDNPFEARSATEQVAVVDEAHVAEPDRGRDPHRSR